MPTTRERVLELTALLSTGRSDQGLAGYYYEEVVRELARDRQLAEVVLLDLEAETGAYQYPNHLVHLMGVFFDDTQLSPMHEEAARAVDPQWRHARGHPECFLVEKDAVRRIRLYPMPEQDSAPYLGLYGLPFGLDFPMGTGVMVGGFISENIPEFWALPVALEVLAREFSRESDHKDVAWAAMCRNLAMLCFVMVGRQMENQQ